MKRITVKFDELNKIIKEMEKNNTHYVELHILGSALEKEDLLPAFVHLQGFDNNFSATDYEGVDAIYTLPH